MVRERRVRLEGRRTGVADTAGDVAGRRLTSPRRARLLLIAARPPPAAPAPPSRAAPALSPRPACSAPYTLWELGHSQIDHANFLVYTHTHDYVE